MTIVKTHTGTVITKDGPQVKKLHQSAAIPVLRLHDAKQRNAGEQNDEKP